MVAAMSTDPSREIAEFVEKHGIDAIVNAARESRIRDKAEKAMAVARELADHFLWKLNRIDPGIVAGDLAAIISVIARGRSGTPEAAGAAAFHQACVARFCKGNHWSLKKGKRPSAGAVCDYIERTRGASLHREVDRCALWLHKQPEFKKRTENP